MINDIRLSFSLIEGQVDMIRIKCNQSIAGEKTDIVLTAKDANGRNFYLKAAQQTPNYNNSFTLNASSSRMVSETSLPMPRRISGVQVR